MTQDAALTRGLRLSLGTLTIIPIGTIGEITPGVARVAMVAAPLAAAPLGVAVTYLLWCAHALEIPSLAAGFAVVGTLALGTRAMHLDGLADTVDGFGAGWSRERALAVMKKGDVGPMGVAALLVTGGLQAACFASLTDKPVVAGAAVVVSRVACTLLASDQLRPARVDGLGAPMVGRVPVARAALVWVMTAGLLWAAVASSDGLAWRAAGAALAADGLATAAVGWLAWRATRILGGITGDVFGAGVEISLSCLLVVLSCGVWR